jgi:hypothetical protein
MKLFQCLLGCDIQIEQISDFLFNEHGRMMMSQPLPPQEFIAIAPSQA